MKTNTTAKITHAYLNAQMDDDSWGHSGPPKNAGRILSILSDVGAEFGLTESTETIGFSVNGDIIHPTDSSASCRNFCSTEIELENDERLTDQDQIDWFSCWCEHPSSRDFERHLRKLLSRHTA
jgi:hypothetical protein